VKTKVCMLTSVHQVFDGRIFYRESKTLLNAGYNVILIAKHDKNEIIDSIEIIALPKPKNRFFRIFGTTLRIFFLAKKLKADVYHFHDPELILVGILLKFFTRKKIIYDVHEHYPNYILHKHWIPKFLRLISSKLFIFLENISVPLFDFVVYTTPVVGNRYKKMKVLTEQIENYPPIELSKNFKRYNKKYIIYLGGVTKIRGICELLKAFNIVIKKYSDWKLFLVGKITPESLVKEIDNLIYNLNIKENIKFVSWVPYEKKEMYSSQATIGIITYLPFANNMSCLPNKLFEYMSVGLPIVASNFQLYKEIIEVNKCGITVDPTNPKEIAKAIEYLIEHPKEAKKMGENGMKAIKEKFNWEKESKKLLEVYNRILCNE